MVVVKKYSFDLSSECITCSSYTSWATGEIQIAPQGEYYIYPPDEYDMSKHIIMGKCYLTDSTDPNLIYCESIMLQNSSNSTIKTYSIGNMSAWCLNPTEWCSYAFSFNQIDADTYSTMNRIRLYHVGVAYSGIYNKNTRLRDLYILEPDKTVNVVVCPTYYETSTIDIPLNLTNPITYVNYDFIYNSSIRSYLSTRNVSVIGRKISDDSAFSHTIPDSGKVWNIRYNGYYIDTLRISTKAANTTQAYGNERYVLTCFDSDNETLLETIAVNVYVNKHAIDGELSSTIISPLSTGTLSTASFKSVSGGMFDIKIEPVIDLTGIDTTGINTLTGIFEIYDGETLIDTITSNILTESYDKSITLNKSYDETTLTLNFTTTGDGSVASTVEIPIKYKVTFIPNP